MSLPSTLVCLIEHLVEDNFRLRVNPLHTKTLENVLFLKLCFLLRVLGAVQHNKV